MTYFHGYTTFHCCETPVPRGRPFRLRHTPLSCRLRAGVGFLGYPVPPPPFVGLTTFIPRSRGGYGFPGSVSKIPIDAVGATLRPGTSTSVCHPEGVPVMARFRCRFGSSVVSPWFHLFRVTILSVIQRLLLPDVVYLADGTDQGSALLHVVPRASHNPVTRDACHGRYVSNG